MKLDHSLIPSQNKLGEGPIWHPAERAVYWVDIHQNLIERFSPVDSQREKFNLPLAVTALGIRASGGFVAATTRGFGFWDGTTEQIELLVNPEENEPYNRFNDGAVGPNGRFWAGTMREDYDPQAPPPGSLYRLDANLIVRKMAPELYISNGIGWSPDKSFMYLTDSPRKTIYRYTYDAASGEISNQINWVHRPDEPYVPDGLAVDAEGCVWSAQWGGWKVIRYDPGGKPIEEIQLPVAHPTSCAFGGPALNELFITSAWTPLSQHERDEQPLSGNVFHLSLDVKGLPQNEFINGSIK